MPPSSAASTGSRRSPAPVRPPPRSGPASASASTATAAPSRSSMADHDAVWAATRPYMRARKNDVHIPMAYGYAQRLLAQHPEVDGEIVLLAILLHDIGWAVVDQGAIYRDAFGPGMMQSE